MNEGRYPDEVVNEAINRLNEGKHPKDVTDELREEYGYERLHPKTVASWGRKYPLGKSPKTLPPKVVREIRDGVRDLDQEERKKSCAEHVFFKDSVKEVFSTKTVASSRTDKVIETQTCRLCGFTKSRRTFFAIN